MCCTSLGARGSRSVIRCIVLSSLYAAVCRHFGILPIGTWKSTVCAARRGGSQVLSSYTIPKDLHASLRELLEAIHQNDVSQIAQGEVVSCNYPHPNPALSISWAGALIPVREVRSVREYTVATDRSSDRSVTQAVPDSQSVNVFCSYDAQSTHQPQAHHGSGAAVVESAADSVVARVQLGAVGMVVRFVCSCVPCVSRHPWYGTPGVY